MLAAADAAAAAAAATSSLTAATPSTSGSTALHLATPRLRYDEVDADVSAHVPKIDASLLKFDLRDLEEGEDVDDKLGQRHRCSLQTKAKLLHANKQKNLQQNLEHAVSKFVSFLVAVTQLNKRLCSLIRPSVCWSMVNKSKKVKTLI